jgi:farnesyl diphosphate synthase
MAFLAELERIAVAVEARLGHLLAGSLLKAPESARLGQAMRYASLGGGKRLRPFLLIESARLFGISEEEALNPACALECIHCYSLVHDDLPAMDDDALRRGRPTVHIAFDQATAILAGDGLLTLAFEILSDPVNQPDAGIRAELVLLLAKAAGWQGMVLGQALDLDAEGHRLSLEEVAKMQSLKTGALFGFACEGGAVLGRAKPEERAALLGYASAFGRAFQLADDLLDAEGDAALLGKAVAKDDARGKATLVALLGRDVARKRLEGLIAEAESALSSFGDKSATLVEAARFVASRRT